MKALTLLTLALIAVPGVLAVQQYVERRAIERRDAAAAAVPWRQCLAKPRWTEDEYDRCLRVLRVEMACRKPRSQGAEFFGPGWPLDCNDISREFGF